MRKIDIEFVRRNVGALGHKAHVTERAGIRDLLVIGRCHCVELTAFRVVDQIEQAGKSIAQIKAPPASVADVENAMQGHILDKGALVGRYHHP